MRILLLGGSGLLSSAARRAFVRAGHDVSVLTRGERAVAPGVRHLPADRRDAALLRAALEGERFDFTADFLAFGGGDVERLLAVPRFSPGRLVAISSGQVYLVTATPEPPFREEAAERPLMGEPAAGTRDHDEWKYGMGKRAMEAALARATGLEALALRIPVVQGEEDRDSSRRLWAWIERMLDGGPVLLPQDGRQVVRFVYAGDVAEALLALAGARSTLRNRTSCRFASSSSALRYSRTRRRDSSTSIVRRSSVRGWRTAARCTGTAGARVRTPRERSSCSACGRVASPSTCHASCARISIRRGPHRIRVMRDVPRRSRSRARWAHEPTLEPRRRAAVQTAARPATPCPALA